MPWIQGGEFPPGSARAHGSWSLAEWMTLNSQIDQPVGKDQQKESSHSSIASSWLRFLVLIQRLAEWLCMNWAIRSIKYHLLNFQWTSLRFVDVCGFQVGLKIFFGNRSQLRCWGNGSRRGCHDPVQMLGDIG
jgi:hypothetical protein